MEFAEAFRDALDEKLRGWIRDNLGRAQPIALRRAIQREKTKNTLAVGTKRLAAGSENVHLRRFADNALGQWCKRIEYVLAAVEDEQHLLAAKAGQASWAWGRLN